MLNKYNLNLISQEFIYDMNKIDYIDSERLNELLDFPNKTYYYNQKKINAKKLNKILDNRNLNKRYNIQYGIINNRCDGKLIPSNIILYNKKTDTYFDRNQALELTLALPIYIIHISTDKLWYFIKTYNYFCWVQKDNVCIVNKIVFNNYLNPNKYIITINNFYIDNRYIDMGIKLPIYRQEKYTTKVIIPKISTTYQELIIDIDNYNINKGYLTYNYNNLYKQALKYLGVHYGWGGMDNGIDCSSFIATIYKTFGYLLPRDTSKQKNIVGNKIIYTQNMNFIEKYKLISSINIPAIIYLDGHVMLLLKNINKRIYVIHASSKFMKVVITQLDNKTIDNITSIHFILN